MFVSRLFSYDCCHSLTTSDHHPVFASLSIDTRLPNPATPRYSKVYLEFSDLCGQDLAFVALDKEPPFLVFYSNVTKSGRMSKRSVVRGPTPKWLDVTVPKLKCLVASRAVLAMGHVSIALRDGKNEVKQHASQRNTLCVNKQQNQIGQCVISLADAAGPAPACFAAQLVNGGLPAGELRGKMMLRWTTTGGNDLDDDDEDPLEDPSMIAGPVVAPAVAAAALANEIVKTGFGGENNVVCVFLTGRYLQISFEAREQSEVLEASLVRSFWWRRAVLFRGPQGTAGTRQGARGQCGQGDKRGQSKLLGNQERQETAALLC
jgi:hypothetical protein